MAGQVWDQGLLSSRVISKSKLGAVGQKSKFLCIRLVARSLKISSWGSHFELGFHRINKFTFQIHWLVIHNSQYYGTKSEINKVMSL